MGNNKLRRIYVTVGRDKELINKLCRVAIENGWIMNEHDQANANLIGKLTETKLEKLINDLGDYKAKTLSFVINSDREILEINFFRLQIMYHTYLSRIDDGHDEAQLQSAIDWIKAQKGTFGSN